MNFEQKTENFRKCRLAIVIDDSAANGKTVLTAQGTGLTSDLLNQMLMISGSQVYVTLNPQRAKSFELEPMSRGAFSSQSALKLLQSVEAREGIHTGISIADRTKTIDILSDSEMNPKMIVKPGHIFPVEIAEGGVLVRASIMEACSDLSLIAGGSDVAVVVDLLNDQGNYPSVQELKTISDKYQLPVFNLSELIVSRLNSTSLVEKVSEADLPLGSGTVFRMRAYRSKLDAVEHVALILGDPSEDGRVMTRVQKENLFTDLFGLQPGSEHSSLRKSINLIEKEGKGLIVYLRASQKDAFKGRQEAKTAIFRDYGIGAQIVKDCGAKKLTLLSSSKNAPEGLESFGLQIEEIVCIT